MDAEEMICAEVKCSRTVVDKMVTVCAFNVPSRGCKAILRRKSSLAVRSVPFSMSQSLFVCKVLLKFWYKQMGCGYELVDFELSRLCGGSRVRFSNRSIH